MFACKDDATFFQVVTAVLNVDGGGFCHRGIVAAAVDMGDAAALDLQIGLGDFRHSLAVVRIVFSGGIALVVQYLFMRVVIVAIAATEEVAYHKHISVDA